LDWNSTSFVFLRIAKRRATKFQKNKHITLKVRNSETAIINQILGSQKPKSSHTKAVRKIPKKRCNFELIPESKHKPL